MIVGNIVIRICKKISNTHASVMCRDLHEANIFESVYRALYLTGLSSADTSIGYKLYSTLAKLLMILLVSGEMWQFFSGTWTIDAISDSVNILVIQWSAIYKYKNKFVNDKVYRRLASTMNSPNFDVSTDERKKLLELWQMRNEAHLKLLLALGTCTLIAWYVYPLVDELDYNLFIAIYVPYNYQFPIIFPITYICLVVAFSCMSYFVMVNELFIQSHLMNLLCQFAILNHCFVNIITDCKKEFKNIDESQLYSNASFRETYRKRLGQLTDQHRFILEISMSNSRYRDLEMPYCVVKLHSNTIELRGILSTPMLAQMGVSTTLICSIGFQVATSVNVNVTKLVMSILYLGYNMSVLYVLCRWCEEVKIQSIAIGDAIYGSGWERGVTKIPGVKSSLLLIMARANKPLVMYAGGIYDFSLEAYASMVKTSYSALTVLLRLR